MSAHVFMPFVMSEMRRMLRVGGGSGALVLPENVGQAPAAVAAQHRSVASLRRVLFEPVDHEATRQFVDDELALQQERDSERWGFDFVLERARSSGQGSKRYVWEVTPQEKIPELYAPRGMEYLGRCAVHGDDAPTPAAATAVASAETTNTKQTSISDFMKKRKRAGSATKSASLAAVTVTAAAAATTTTTTTTTTEPKKARLSNS